MSRKPKARQTKRPSANAACAVEFTFDAPEAQQVLLVGDFTQWDSNPIRLAREEQGVWRARVPLTPGCHEYRYIVDGVWQCDPCCCDCVPNPFGSCNCLVHVA